MYSVRAQCIVERIINVRYYFYFYCPSVTENQSMLIPIHHQFGWSFYAIQGEILTTVIFP